MAHGSKKVADLWFGPTSVPRDGAAHILYIVSDKLNSVSSTTLIFAIVTNVHLLPEVQKHY